LKTLIIILSILRVAFVGDPQVDNPQELGYARASIYKELRERRDLDLVVVLGDLVNDNPSLIAESKASLDSLPCPWICAPGNHDKDVYRQTRQPRDTRTFKEVLGYVDTCFVMGGIRFVSLDNVRTISTGGYEGGLSEPQKQWLASVLEDNKEPLVLCAHIPFTECVGQDTLSTILAPHRDRMLMMCGHTHNVLRSDTGFGCEEVQAGATCGSWWRGVKDADGIPLALMNCGAPRGYFVAEFRPHRPQWYSLSYKCVGRSAAETMSVTRRDGKVYVNVYGGSHAGKVEMRVRGHWTVLEPCQEPAPEVMDVIEFNKSHDRAYRRQHRDEFIPMRRLNSPHLWAADDPGTKKLRIRYSE